MAGVNRTILVAAILICVAACAAGVYWFLHSPLKAPAVKRSIGIQLVPIAPGSFIMGSEEGNSHEKPVHKVNITRSFLIGATEVTQKQYKAVMGLNPSHFTGDDLPVEQVKWADASEFCRRLTEIEKGKGDLPEGYEYRLPTEAEWEYCCRAGSTTEYCFGDDEAVLGEYAWFDKNSGETTHLVGTKKPNAWGLHDMHGNVIEWMLDWYEDYRDGEQSDPRGPLKSRFKLIHGSSWLLPASCCSSVFRANVKADASNFDCGFRVVCAPSIWWQLPESLRTAYVALSEGDRQFCDVLPAAKREEYLWLTGNDRVALTLEICRPSLGIPFVPIAAGSFIMGSDKGEGPDKPAHKVAISHPFLMGATEVTQAQYRAVMDANPSLFRAADLPVELVSWNNADAFCRELTKNDQEEGILPEGYEYRLPTETEWEYCCRAGATTEYCFGDDEVVLGEYAWFSGNSGRTTHPVGTKKANAWGLNDMNGNVYEWCYDWYADKYQPGDQTDPVGPATGQYRVLRGGSWNSIAGYCRSADRVRSTPDYRSNYIGFRVVVAPQLVQP